MRVSLLTTRNTETGSTLGQTLQSGMMESGLMIRDGDTELLHTPMEVVTKAHSKITSGTAWARLLFQTEVTTSAHGKMM